jgi:hypothetical protein
MENDKLYKILFYIGSGWNFAVAISLFVLIGSLPTIVQIEPPKYNLFIYFNLMTIFIFGCMQWTVAKDLFKNRNMVVILMWAKFALIIIFVYALIFDTPVKELSVFLAPGMVIDLLFGLIFWRFLIYSRAQIKNS